MSGLPQMTQPVESDADTSGTRSLSAASRRQRPPAHYCPACACLMLTTERRPVRLEPCGHPVCCRCASPSGGIVCPTCRAAASRGRHDAALQAEVANFPNSGAARSNASNVGGSRPLQDLEPVRLRLEIPLGPSKDSAPGSQPRHHPQAPEHPPWHQQLAMIGGRMRGLEATLSQLQSELDGLNRELSTELARERQMKQSEAETREAIDRLQEEMRQLGEQRAASRDAQVFVQSQIEAKKRAVQLAMVAQHNMNMELSKMQSLCGGQ